MSLPSVHIKILCTVHLLYSRQRSLGGPKWYTYKYTVSEEGRVERTEASFRRNLFVHVDPKGGKASCVKIIGFSFSDSFPCGSWQLRESRPFSSGSELPGACGAGAPCSLLSSESAWKEVLTLSSVPLAVTAALQRSVPILCRLLSGRPASLLVCPGCFLLTDVTSTILSFWFFSTFLQPLPSASDLSLFPARVPRVTGGGVFLVDGAAQDVVQFGWWEESAPLDTHLLFLGLTRRAHPQ